jgi:hypothetical protein
MFLDDQGIARVCTWTNAEELGRPDWAKVATIVEAFEINPSELLTEFRRLAKTVKELPQIMESCGVDPFLIDRLRMRIEETASALSQV